MNGYRPLSGLGDDNTDWFSFGDGGATPGDNIDYFGGEQPAGAIVLPDLQGPPPSVDIGSGIDVNKLVQTATGTYQYVKTVIDGQTKYVPQQVNNKGVNTPPSSASMKTVLPIIGIGLALFLLKGAH